MDLGPPAQAVRPNPSHVEDRTGGWVNYWTVEEHAEVVARRERKRRERRRRDKGVGGRKGRAAWRKGKGAMRARGPDGRFI